jgi:hypothetical protein
MLMFTESQPHREGARLTTVPDIENAPSSPEHLRPGREDFTVTYLNTSFSSAFDHPEGLDDLLLQDKKPRESAIFGFSEVTRGQRPDVSAQLEGRGYQVVEPPEDSHLDLLWAVSPNLEVESSDAYHFARNGIRRFASRQSDTGYRHVGMHDMTVVTPQGNKIRLAQERLSPWVIEPVRRKQLQDMARVLKEHFPPDDRVLLTINGGDQNHVDPFRKPDYRLWERLEAEEGWKPMLEPYTPTHTTDGKYPKTSKAFASIGRNTDGQQLDAVYTRPATGAELVNIPAGTETDLQPNQISYSTRTKPVPGTDHFAVETIFSLPTPPQPKRT